jgi:hypothetical protein
MRIGERRSCTMRGVGDDGGSYSRGLDPAAREAIKELLHEVKDETKVELKNEIMIEVRFLRIIPVNRCFCEC